MVAAIIAGAITIVAILALTTAGIVSRREPDRPRRRQLTAAHKTVNDIDDVVDQYHPQLDLVGQAMAAEIRQLISKHRKDITR